MSITDQQSSFIQSNEGNLTPEQATMLLDMADGDSAQAQLDNEPDIITDDGQQPDNSVVLAKDGVHTIPYEKLVEARNGEKQWKQQYESMQAQYAQLQAEANARAAAGYAPTGADQQLAAAEAAMAEGVDPDLFGDFSEEALAAGIQKLIEQQVSAKIGAALQPLQAKEVQNATQSHFDSIYAAHPDADSIAESRELADWVNAQPSYAQDAIKNVLSGGTASQVVELLNQFKGATGQNQNAGMDMKTKAQAAINGVQRQVPTSLSDFPAGRTGAGATQQDVMAGMNPLDLSMALEGMPPDKIEEFLNRLI